MPLFVFRDNEILENISDKITGFSYFAVFACIHDEAIGREITLPGRTYSADTRVSTIL